MMQLAATTPTARWLSCVADIMSPLDGPAGTAERLLLLIHYGIDWDSWIGAKRGTYWDRILPDRIICATYRADNLRLWWSCVAATLESHPRSPEERSELAALLEEEPLPVLELLRTQTEPLLLRTRIVADAVRAQKAHS